MALDDQPQVLDARRHPPLSPAMPPRVSMSQITTLGRSFEADVDAFVASGCAGIGLSVRKLDATGTPVAGRMLRAANLAVSCLTSSGGFPLADPDAVRQAVARTIGHLHAAAELACPALFLLPGIAPRWSWEEAAAGTRGILEELLREAERVGVRLLLEPVSQLRVDLGFLHSFDEALDYADSFGSPFLGVVLELNNAWIERRLYENIASRTDQIGIVQISDFKVGTLAVSERVVIGDGDMPLRRICRALADAGYGGWYDIELLGPAIEAEGYDAVVPRALQRFASLWT
jgi:sugar phosphate isomerase/epimerase